MTWGDEQWVKLYTRDTAEWTMLSLGARGLFYELTRKCNHAGLIAVGRHGAMALAGLVRAPWAEIEGPIAELLADGCVELVGGNIVLVNFVEAQTAVSSPRERKRRERSRDRDEALNIPESLGSDVTPSHAASRGVTRGHYKIRGDKIRGDKIRKENTPHPPQAAGELPLGPTAPKQQKLADPRHQKTIDLFAQIWTEVRGGNYAVVGGRDGDQVKALLRRPEATIEEIEKRMRIAFSDPWFTNAGNLAIFVSRWSNYDGNGSGAAKKPAKGRYFVRMDEDGRPVYSENPADA